MLEIPTWFIYSIITMVLVGFFSFFTKIQSESKNDDFYFFSFQYIAMIIFSIICFFVFNKSLIINLQNLSLSFLFMILYFFVLKSRFAALKYINTSTYFINYRIFSSILLIFIGQIFFSESISIKKYIGILLGFFIFYLLFGKKEKTETTKNLKLGISLIFVGVILISILQAVSKWIAINEIDLFSILFFEGIFGIIILLISKRKNLKNSIKFNFGKKWLLYYFVFGCVNYFSTLFSIWSFETGDLAVVYKVMSYSIFIPIILSIIFYKEKVNLKQIIAFILTIVSLWFFI
jgi:uncharacterized membrane protein